MPTNIAASAIGGAVSGLFGLLGQDKMIQAQKEENELAFKRNRQLAQEQNQFNLEQWNRANEYNSPTQVIQRLKDAGLSPALAYQNGTGMQSAAPSPTLSSGTPYNPVDVTLGGQRKTYADIFQSAMNSAMQAKQMELLDKQINKTQSETNQIDLENQFLPQLSQADIELKVEQMNLTKENQKQVKQLIEESKFNIEKGQEQMKVFQAQVRDIDSQILFREFQKILSDNQFNLDKFVAETNANLTNAQTTRIIKMLPYEIEGQNMSNQESYSRVMCNLATHAGLLNQNEISAYEAVLAGQKKEFILKHTGYTSFNMVIEAADKVSNVLESVSRTADNFFGMYNSYKFNKTVEKDSQDDKNSNSKKDDDKLSFGDKVKLAYKGYKLYKSLK